VFRLSFHFGLFQALMPVIGWLAGRSVQEYIIDYDHWIAFVLLALIGGHMIYAALNPDHEKKASGDPTRGLSLVVLSVATSIDALAVGLSLAMLEISVWRPALVIGLVAGIFTIVGLYLGRRISDIWGSRVELLGGSILILIGVRIVIEHVFG